MKLKRTKLDFGRAFAQTPLGELTMLPQTLYLDFRGLVLRKREGMDIGEGWEGKEGNGNEGKGE